jgi:serine/threonine protein phosphatase 1
MVFGRSVQFKGDQPAGPKGHRVYAVGDIHGRLDLLDELLGKIEADDRERPKAKTSIVFLGDLIDRGPQSAEVVERLRLYRPAFARTVFIAGNHEEVLLQLLGGETDLLANWLLYGGAECARSYGIEPDELRRAGPDDALSILKARIPREHETFLSSFVDTASFGDYLFVHAGIRPGVPLANQDKSDLRWIRRPFLDDDSRHGHVVVHGHTISEEVEVRPNRIGIDTGAYRSGILTALGIEGRDRWLLQTGAMQHPEWRRVANVAEAY